MSLRRHQCRAGLENLFKSEISWRPLDETFTLIKDRQNAEGDSVWSEIGQKDQLADRLH